MSEARAHKSTKKNTADSAVKKNINSVPAAELSRTVPEVLVQRKLNCVCGGVCPRCLAEHNIQARLKIGAANDRFEQEADQIADQVMRMPDLTSFSSREQLSHTVSVTSLNKIQRACVACEEEEVLIQPKSKNAEPEVTPKINAGIQTLKGTGKPLSRADRYFFGSRFGTDFFNVRIYNNTQAASVAQSINARAFTFGSNVVFGAGEYAPGTLSGGKLLAHELTHVLQQNGSDTTIRRQDGEAEEEADAATDQIELCFVPIGRFGIGLVGGTHSVLNIHRGNRVTRFEVDPSNHEGIEDPAAASQGPGRAAGIHSHVLRSTGARSTGRCQIFNVTPTQAANAIVAADRYESMDVVYEPPGVGPNSNSFGEWVLHEAGVNTATITADSGALGWGWYIDNPGSRSSPPRVARTFQGTAAGCSQSYVRVRGFRALIDLIRAIEDQLITCGMSDVGERLSLMRGVFYGTPWSRDFGTSQQSHARNQMFNLYSGTSQPRNPIECVDCGLFLSLGESQDVVDGSRRVDVGHMLIGMDARRSYMARNAPQPVGQVTGLEATTWAGDLGGGAARLAMARRSRSGAVATEFFRGSDYGGSINLEGDIAAYAVAASSATAGDAPALGIPSGGGVADALELYLMGTSASEGTPAVVRGWNSRCTTFITAVGGTFNSSGVLTNRSDVIDYLAEQIHDFGCWYMVTFQSNHPLTTQQMIEASRHLEGSANEVAEVFLSALERCHNTPNSPLAAHGSPPSPTPIGSPSCMLALAGPRLQDTLEGAREEGGRILDNAQREGSELLNDADEWVERRRREAQRWWRNF